MGLDPETERRILELFAGQRCCRCGRTAARLAGDQFYCPDHFPYRRAKDNGTTPRAFHHPSEQKG